jgi:hypothetical protein
MSESEKPAHSRFGGSKAERWMNCAGAPALCDTVPQIPSSKYAVEGTAAHSVGEGCLRENTDAEEYLGRQIEAGDTTVLVTKEMAAAVQIYLDAVRLAYGEHEKCVLLIEEKFVFDIASADKDEVFGANDAMVYNPGSKKLTVFDYKHGIGEVEAENNKQLKFYAAGAALSHPDWPIAEVEIVIVQPRARNADDLEEPGIKRWAMEPMDLLEFTAEIEAAVAAAKIEGAPLVPGPWCKKTYCEAVGVCLAREQSALYEATLDYQNVEVVRPKDLPLPRDIDTVRLGRMLAGFKILEGWMKQVEDYAFGLLQSGVPIPGYKLVDKVGRRQWIEDEKAIADYLTAVYGLDEDNVRPRKLATITEVERQLKGAIADKAQLKEAKQDVELAFTLKESSGQTMAPDSDKRDAVNAAERDFSTVKV